MSVRSSRSSSETSSWAVRPGSALAIGRAGGGAGTRPGAGASGTANASAPAESVQVLEAVMSALHVVRPAARSKVTRGDVRRHSGSKPCGIDLRLLFAYDRSTWSALLQLSEGTCFL